MGPREIAQGNWCLNCALKDEHEFTEVTPGTDGVKHEGLEITGECKNNTNSKRRLMMPKCVDTRPSTKSHMCSVLYSSEQTSFYKEN